MCTDIESLVYVVDMFIKDDHERQRLWPLEARNTTIEEPKIVREQLIALVRLSKYLTMWQTEPTSFGETMLMSKKKIVWAIPLLDKQLLTTLNGSLFLHTISNGKIEDVYIKEDHWSSKGWTKNRESYHLLLFSQLINSGICSIEISSVGFSLLCNHDKIKCARKIEVCETW